MYGREPALPLPEIQIFGGGAHAGRRVDIQDFMVIVPGAADFEEVLEVTSEIYFAAGAIVPYMQKADYGRIVNISSMAGKDGNPNASAYSVSKAGVITLTKSLGKELATTNIRVNAITPAVIETEMLAEVTEEQLGYMLAKIPMGRMGTVDEIAAMVAWLCSDECSYSTGAVFDLSGGRATY